MELLFDIVVLENLLVEKVKIKKLKIEIIEKWIILKVKIELKVLKLIKVE